MRAYLLPLILLAAGCNGCASVGQVQSYTARLEIGRGSCSATAVGPHTILSAEHCFTSKPTEIRVNGKLAKIKSIVLDGADHALVTVDLTFTNIAKIGPAPEIGDRVCLNGNPGFLKSVYRCGMVSMRQDNATGYDINTYFGDSGSAIFDRAGRVVGVVSAVNVQSRADNPVRIQLAVSFDMKFSAKQWARTQ